MERYEFILNTLKRYDVSILSLQKISRWTLLNCVLGMFIQTFRSWESSKEVKKKKMWMSLLDERIIHIVWIVFIYLPQKYMLCVYFTKTLQKFQFFLSFCTIKIPFSCSSRQKFDSESLAARHTKWKKKEEIYRNDIGDLVCDEEELRAKGI